MQPLHEEHWREAELMKEVLPLDPDPDAYVWLGEAAVTRCFTIRDNSGSLIGYSVLHVRENPHTRQSVQATQDILFVKKERRSGGIGAKFILWVDKQ